ncbi:hypothetical protein BaRGS_00026922, partial [Batillaria attramentaria]
MIALIADDMENSEIMGVNSCFHLNASDNRAIMLSFWALYVEHCPSHLIVDLYTHNGCAGDKIHRISGQFPKPQVFKTSVLSIHFVNGISNANCEGFEILFSFHKAGEVPVQFPDGKWNCAVEYVGEFEGHLSSDRELDCAPTPKDVFKDLVMFNGTNVSDCFLHSKRLNIWAHEGHIVLDKSFSSGDLAAGRLSCTLQINVVKDKVVQFDVIAQDCSGSLIWRLEDTRNRRKQLLGPKLRRTKYGFFFETCDISLATTSVSSGHQVQLFLHLSQVNSSASPSFHFHFKAVPPRPELEVVYHPSLRAGYVQTPGWDGVTPYPSRMDSCVTVIVPEDHSVMVSMVAVYTEWWTDFYNVHFEPEPTCDAQMAFTRPASGKVGFPFLLLTTPRMYVSFYSNDRNEMTGFKLLFSFHNFSSTPEQLPSSQWNCAVPYYSDFQQHFQCSLAVNCVGGEDEWFCPESFDACGIKHLSHLTSCYKLVNDKEGCQNDSQLLIINSVDEWSILKPFFGLHPLQIISGDDDRQICYHTGLSAAYALPE